MARLAKGTKGVGASALGPRVRPSREVAARPLNELTRHMEERFELRKAHLALVNPLLAKARKELLGVDEKVSPAIKALKKALAPAKRTVKRKGGAAFDVATMTGAAINFEFKVPPYDTPFESSFGYGIVRSDVRAGGYSLSIKGDGNFSSGSAGLGVYFLAPHNTPFQRFATQIGYDYEWGDWSSLETAHNDAGTNVWVWGFTEDRWVYRTAIDPSWSDGTSWYEEHGSNGEQTGTENIEIYFPTQANSWYEVWVWSYGTCDEGSLSGSWQYQSFGMPWVVFGSL